MLYTGIRNGFNQVHKIYFPCGSLISTSCLERILGLGLLHKIRLNFLGASQHFLFYRVGLLAPRPTPIPGDQASVFISPRARVATHFSRLLRHAWVTTLLNFQVEFLNLHLLENLRSYEIFLQNVIVSQLVRKFPGFTEV
jgi:hypothetical protein